MTTITANQRNLTHSYEGGERRLDVVELIEIARVTSESYSFHTKVESTVRYLGVEVDDALAIAEQVDV